MAFHEVRFPDDISRGARGGPERRTQVVELASGDEERNASWADSRRRYDAAYGIRRADDLAAVVAFFEARNGRLHGFRWKDWGDYRSGLPSAPVTPIDQALGTGDGDTEAFQLVKRYESGAQAWVRRIVKPVAGTVRVALAGVEPALRLVGRCDHRRSSPSTPRPPPACSSPPASSSTCRCASTPTGSTSPGTSTGSARSPRSRWSRSAADGGDPSLPFRKTPPMQTTDRGLLALVRHEGIVPAPYLDVKRVWTFGVGHTAAAGAPDPARMPRGMPADLDAGLARGLPALPRRPRPLRGRGAARRDRAARSPRVRCAGLLPLQHRRDRAGGADPGAQRRRPGGRGRGVHELAPAGQRCARGARPSAISSCTGATPRVRSRSGRPTPTAASTSRGRCAGWASPRRWRCCGPPPVVAPARAAIASAPRPAGCLAALLASLTAAFQRS